MTVLSIQAQFIHRGLPAAQIIVEDALAQAMQLPYSVFDSGPYTPPCNEERVAYSNSLNLMDSPPDPQVSIMIYTTSLPLVESSWRRSAAPSSVYPHSFGQMLPQIRCAFRDTEGQESCVGGTHPDVPLEGF